MAVPSEKPLKKLPGGYGLPYFGALSRTGSTSTGSRGRLNTSSARWKSTIARCTGSTLLGFPDPKGVVLLDQKSFTILLDNTKVDKTDTLIGPYMPDLAFTGGYRALPYLDTREEKHTLYKNQCSPQDSNVFAL